MPYIEKERVAEFRTLIRKEFPQFKISVTCRDYCCVVVKIMSGDVDFGISYKQINHYNIEKNHSGRDKEVLERIYNIISKDKHIESEDSDYGSIPNYYIHMSIGDWDKPYKLIKN